jgi:hypothetical protein
MVNTEKLVLIHNDMVIGKHFLENLDKLCKENIILSYTVIEPPIFLSTYTGKVLLDLGRSFNDFNYSLFNQYVEENKDNNILYDGGRFFMCGYKNAFEDVGYFDGFSFVPAFCEDDDFLIRAKLKGYKLKTTDCAMCYHFVSQTSRYSEEYKNNAKKYEESSNKNFIRKWGIRSARFSKLKYWECEPFSYNQFLMGLTSERHKTILFVEPFFNKINTKTIPIESIGKEQLNTRYDLMSKFINPEVVDVMIYEKKELTIKDIEILMELRISISHFTPGKYELENMIIEIRSQI